MRRLDKTAAALQRIAIAALLNEGKGYMEISALTGASSTTIASVRKIMNDPNSSLERDGREGNGADIKYTAEAKAAIVAMREQTGLGATMLWELVKREPEKYGYDVNNIPSAAMMHRWLSEENMTTRMIGSKDRRGFPIDFPDAPGIIAIDEYGPRLLAGNESIYLVSFADRYTRLTGAVPIFKKGSTDSFRLAMNIARSHLLDGAAPSAIWCDNGIGMALASGYTSQAVRHALSMGSRIVFNAPHHPWKNGRLENWHYRQEREFWRLLDPKTRSKEAIEKFVGYLNWYNLDRPHQSLKRQNEAGKIESNSPADLATWYKPIAIKDLVRGVERYAELEPQTGIIDMVRLVHNRGKMELQNGETMTVSPMFGGGYLRIRFHLQPGAEKQIGEVIWQRGQEKLPVTVATFNHFIDRKRSQSMPLVTDIHTENFDLDEMEFFAPEKIDEAQYAKKAARIGKKKLKETPHD